MAAVKRGAFADFRGGGIGCLFSDLRSSRRGGGGFVKAARIGIGGRERIEHGRGVGCGLAEQGGDGEQPREFAGGGEEARLAREHGTPARFGFAPFAAARADLPEAEFGADVAVAELWVAKDLLEKLGVAVGRQQASADSRTAVRGR